MLTRPKQENSSFRVLMITDVTLPGGVCTHMVQLASQGQAEGWDVRVLMDDGCGSDSSANSFRQLGLLVERGPLARKVHREQTIRRSVLAAFESNRPDIVHVHCGSPRSALVPRELTVRSSLPLIFTEHYVAADLEINQDMLLRIKNLYRRASAVISVCEANRALLREHFGLYSGNHLVIRNGVDMSSVPRRKGRSSSEFRALTVARLTRQKGVDTLLHAIAKLPGSVRRRFRFTIAGDGEEADKLCRLAQALRLTKCVKFIGWSRDVHALLRNHDLFILPSRAEGQPIALLEALAAGLPCIASAVSGIPEALGHGVYGMLTKPDDPGSLRNALASFADTPSLFLQKSSAVRTHLAANFEVGRNMGEVVGLWGSVLE